MDNRVTNYIFLAALIMMTLQMFLGLIQVKAYKKAMNSLRGTGIVALGHTKGNLIKMGQIIVLSYKRSEDKVVACKIMKGITIFARFKNIDKYNGFSLEELRSVALNQDSKEFKRRRKKHPYDPKEITKKKGALIQVVEAIDDRIVKDDKKKGKTTCKLGYIN